MGKYVCIGPFCTYTVKHIKGKSILWMTLYSLNSFIKTFFLPYPFFIFLFYNIALRPPVPVLFIGIVGPMSRTFVFYFFYESYHSSVHYYSIIFRYQYFTSIAHNRLLVPDNIKWTYTKLTLNPFHWNQL